MPRRPPAAHRTPGFALLEVMTALVVLAIGLLGCAALLAAGLRADRAALDTGIATQRIGDMVARLRASSASAAAYGSPLAYAEISVSASPPLCGIGTCTAASRAADDIAAWNAANAQLLRGGRGTVALDADRALTVTLMWSDAALAGRPDPRERLDPACARKSPAERLPGVRCIHMRVRP